MAHFQVLEFQICFQGQKDSVDPAKYQPYLQPEHLSDYTFKQHLGPLQHSVAGWEKLLNSSNTVFTYWGGKVCHVPLNQSCFLQCWLVLTLRFYLKNKFFSSRKSSTQIHILFDIHHLNLMGHNFQALEYSTPILQRFKGLQTTEHS